MINIQHAKWESHGGQYGEAQQPMWILLLCWKYFYSGLTPHDTRMSGYQFLAYFWVHPNVFALKSRANKGVSLHTPAKS
jgi:hypothetical protein